RCPAVSSPVAGSTTLLWNFLAAMDMLRSSRTEGQARGAPVPVVSVEAVMVRARAAPGAVNGFASAVIATRRTPPASRARPTPVPRRRWNGSEPNARHLAILVHGLDTAPERAGATPRTRRGHSS